MIIDIVTEILLNRGEESRNVVWPLLSEQLQLWIIGRSSHNRREKGTSDALSMNGNSPPAPSWQPCEALIRVACRELRRFPQRLFDAMTTMLGENEVAAWSELFCKDMASTLSNVVTIETGIHEELLRLKLEAIGISGDEEEVPSDPAQPEACLVDSVVETPYGKGRVVEQRTDTFSDGGGGIIAVVTDVVQLDTGATLYRQAPGSMQFKEAPAAVSAQEGEAANRKRQLTRETLWEKFIPALKVQCVAAYCLQQSLFDQLELLIPLLELNVISPLLDALDQSRSMSSRACRDQDLSLAFQEAMFSEWGDGVEEVEEALQVGRSSNRSGSATFFLTQEAGAANNSIHILSLLYRSKGSLERETFAEPLLLDQMMEVLNKFLLSETEEGHLIDPNIWRNASKSGEKVAIYCTSFAFVVVSILNVMLAITPEQFTQHKEKFFPALCLLVRVQSEEIRHLVSHVLQEQVSPLLNVNILM